MAVQQNAPRDNNEVPAIMGVVPGVGLAPVQLDSANGIYDSSTQTTVYPVVTSSSGSGDAVSIANGADVAQGSIADTAYTSGSGTVISLLKGLFSKLASIVTNTGATALESGGHLASVDTKLTTINTTLNAPMQNSGGSVTANAGTNLNTSLLALESGGNLAAILTALNAGIKAAANSQTIIASTPLTAQTTTITIADADCSKIKEFIFYLTLANIAGVGATVTPKFNGKAPDGTYYTIQTTTGLMANGKTAYVFAPGAGSVAGGVFGQFTAFDTSVPNTIQVILTFTSVDSVDVTYSATGK